MEKDEVVIRKGIPVVSPSENTNSSIPSAQSLRSLRKTPSSGQLDNITKVPINNNWRFCQCFGDKNEQAEISDGDLISALAFDGTGEYLASGDRAGRVVIFERMHKSKSSSSLGDTSLVKKTSNAEYKFYTEFQSHEAEFDYLKSLEINERINGIAWTRRTGDALFLLSTNGTISYKTIKLWKVKERLQEAVIENNQSTANRNNNSNRLKLPRTQTRGDPIITAVPKQTFPHCHAYHIHSISACSDAETFLTADDLRINVWRLDHVGGVHMTGQSNNTNTNAGSFNLVDLKPHSIEELTEVITCASFHPKHCNLFGYGTSKGSVRLGDMRASALCDRACLCLNGMTSSHQAATNTFFTEIISSVSDFQFHPIDDHLIAARDYLSVKIYDIRGSTSSQVGTVNPVHTLPVHDNFLKQKLCELYENDCIFDRFKVSWAGTDSVVTGSYGNRVRVLSLNTDGVEELRADRSAIMKTGKRGSHSSSTMDVLHSDTDTNIDSSRKALNVAVDPVMQTMAIGGTSNLYIFGKNTSAGSSRM